MNPLVFTPAAAPEASIVIVTYGQWRWARLALEAVLEQTPEPYEIVLVDNASPDDTAERIQSEVRNARILLNERNHGFGAACNQGAAAARGRCLVFLNSDALVHAGWLPPLIEALELPRVAAAGPRLVNLDGTLQEAGAMISRTYGATGYGFDQAPDRLDFRFRRVVDYVSAACLAVRRSAFNAVGGFDLVYGRGYFEDVDLCFALAERGLATMFEPRSVVTHARWASHGGDLAAELVEQNRAVFAERWRHALANRLDSLGQESPRHLVSARDDRANERLLVVSERIPDEDQRLFDLLAELARERPRARITLLALDQWPLGAATDALLASGIEIAVPSDFEAWLAARRFHYDTVMLFDRGAARRVRSALLRTQPQAELIELATAAAALAGASLHDHVTLALAAAGNGVPEDHIVTTAGTA